MQSNEQIQDIKRHEGKLMEKTLEFTEKLARIQTQQEHLEEHIINLQDNISKEIKTSVTARMDGIQEIVSNQQSAQNEILKIQGKQGEQINSIQKTLEEFTEIRKQVTDHENRIKDLEFSRRSERELQKEKIKGRWTTIAAVVAGIASIIAALIAGLIK